MSEVTPEFARCWQAAGKPPHLDEKSRQDLLKQLENVRKTPVGRLLGGGAPAPEKKKSKWWPF
jgi:hypothetical protein